MPLTETDPNGATTQAKYDEFGRIAELKLPDKNTGQPSSSYSLQMKYVDGAPFTTFITQHVSDTPTDSYYTIKRTYDGMGRQVQSISYDGTDQTTPSALTAVYTSAEYQVYPASTSNVTVQSVPYHSGDTIQYNVTTNNLNARTSTVTAPDGTSTVTYTNGLTSTVTDPRGNVTTSVKDVWGRTLSATPPTGPAVTYTYDEQGNMLTASRRGVTTLS